jgi:two-component system phosphate regulon response regulator PhoB
MARIFVVEDNENIREVITSYLKLKDHEVVEFGRIKGIMEALNTKLPDLIILDVMLPDGDGFHLTRRIRDRYEVPILFLTAKSSESDRVTGFEMGGDDYVVKPFSPKELSLRVEAILKRTRYAEGQKHTSEKWTHRNKTLELDQIAHRATVGEKNINLTSAEWKILTYLASHAGMVIERNRLLGEGLDYLIGEGSERTIDTHIKNLRVKLGHSGWIETVRGFGYRFSGKPR